MLRNLIADSSTLIALERADLLKFLDKINYKIIIPESVSKEVGDIEKYKNIQIDKIKGRTLKKSISLRRLINEGEADCIVLARKYKLNFIVCDDRKLLRQIFFSQNRAFKNIKIIGFSFFLHEFFKNSLINDIWKFFNLIVEKSNWARSEVYVANFTFLRDMGY